MIFFFMALMPKAVPKKNTVTLILLLSSKIFQAITPKP